MNGQDQDTVGAAVLDFYRKLPFNVFSSPEAARRHLLQHNPIAGNYADLDAVLRHPAQKSFLDVGCGSGWLAISVQHYYGIRCYGMDFNPEVIAIARQLSQECGTDVEFEQQDLLLLPASGRSADVVCSLGVLHHTADPFAGLRSLTQVLSPRPQARIYLGLYHRYGRKPFLEAMQQSRQSGADDDKLFEEFSTLTSKHSDSRHLRSWFADQVLHPHESLHSLAEVADWCAELHLTIETTSINRFQPIRKLSALFEEEKLYERLSFERNVLQKKFFPGLFTVCLRRI
jgi:2-polyprenyl-3-methyl-5-hydroxy-6-metoxy-1,4-benzoquinol methylase